MNFKKIAALTTAIGIFALSVTTTLAASTGKITADVLNVRAGASTDSAILGQLVENETVTIEGTVGNWYQITFENNTAYISGTYVTITDKSMIVTADVLNIRAAASTDSQVLGQLTRGSTVIVTEQVGDWYKTEYMGKEAYVHASYLSEVAIAPVESGKGDQIVAEARKYVGVPYRYGGASPSGFDCSGFTYYVFKQFGIYLPHRSSEQINYGTRVEKANLQPGDLVFFSNSSSGSGRIGHVGIYTGNNRFIHAPYTGRTVCETDMTSDYYIRNYIGATRLY